MSLFTILKAIYRQKLTDEELDFASVTENKRQLLFQLIHTI
jgi:hypothetical protein